MKCAKLINFSYSRMIFLKNIKIEKERRGFKKDIGIKKIVWWWLFFVEPDFFLDYWRGGVARI